MGRKADGEAKGRPAMNAGGHHHGSERVVNSLGITLHDEVPGDLLVKVRQ